jgi:hypothetical protein
LRFGTEDALSRHRTNHQSLHTATGLATAVEIKAILDKAETAATLNAILLGLREARRRADELMAVLTLLRSAKVHAKAETISDYSKAQSESSHPNGSQIKPACWPMPDGKTDSVSG